MDCPDLEQFEQFVERNSSVGREDRIRRHLQSCASCQELVSEVAENLQVLEPLQRLPHPTEPNSGEASSPPVVRNFTILREIGRGGMGTVYEAQQQTPRRRVALKVLREGHTDAYRVKLFQREARALARLKHPGIASICEAGQAANGQHYLIMDLAEGVPLGEYVRARNPGGDERLRLCGRIARAINHAHQHGVIHRDIKPSNVLVDAEGNPKILDFGLARIVDPDATMVTSVTEIGRLQGTLPYMSPEQLRGDSSQVDLRTDVYSLGVILYELLTGRLPHDVQGKAPHEALRYLAEATPANPHDIRRNLRGDLETIMLKAMEKDADQRYQSALALAEDLERYLSNQPILARPPSGLYQLRKLVARHRLPCAAAAGFVLLVMGFGIWMSALYARAQRAEQLAQANLSAMAVARDQAETEAERANAETRRANQAVQLAQERLEEVNRSRADLETVTSFQADMLSGIDPQQLGQNVLADLRDRIEQALRGRDMASPEIEQVLESLDEALGAVNRADFATALLHQNILSRASETIAEEFADQPLVEASLRSTLGTTYGHLGDFGRAESNMTAAWKIRRRELGDDHRETLTSLNNRAEMIQEQGRFDEAEPLFVETWERRRRALGEDDQDTLLSIHNLGRIHQLQGRYDEAEAEYFEALQKRRRVLGEEHSDTLTSKNELGNFYTIQERLAEAEPLVVEAFQGRLRTLGREHPDTLDAMSNLARIHWQQGRYDESLALLQEILEIRRQTLGREHHRTASALENVAVLYEAQGRYDRAEPLHVAALECLRRALGGEHADTLQVMNNLASLYYAQGDYRRSEPLNAQTLEYRRRLLGDEHPETLKSMHNLAAVYKNQERYDEAEPLWIEMLQIGRRVLGEQHASLLVPTNNLAGLYQDLYRFDEAEQLFVPALETSRRQLGLEHPTTLMLASNLGAFYREMGRYDEAEPLLLAAVAGARSSLTDGHWRTGMYLSNLGSLWTRLERYEEAEEILLESHRILERTLGATNRQTDTVTRALVRLYEAWDRPEEAAKYKALLPPPAEADPPK